MKATAEMRAHWETLPKGNTLLRSSMSKANCYGLLSSGGQPERAAGILQYCLACTLQFTDRDDARTHPCSYEEEFREVTGRYEGIFDVAKTKKSDKRALTKRKAARKTEQRITEKLAAELPAQPTIEPTLTPAEKTITFPAAHEMYMAYVGLYEAYNELHEENVVLSNSVENLTSELQIRTDRLDLLDKELHTQRLVKISNDQALGRRDR